MDSLTDVVSIPAFDLLAILGYLLWFILGFLLYATAYAAVATTVSRQEEVSGRDMMSLYDPCARPLVHAIGRA
jgi:hypothetical protein